MTAHSFDAGLIPRHVGPDAVSTPLEIDLFHGLMQLITSLMRAQTRLHEAGYQTAVRTAIVGPAHTAVRDAAWELARLAARAPGAAVPDTSTGRENP